MSQDNELFRSGRSPTSVRVAPHHEPHHDDPLPHAESGELRSLQRARDIRQIIREQDKPAPLEVPERAARTQATPVLAEVPATPVAPEPVQPAAPVVPDTIKTVDGQKLDPRRTRVAMSSALRVRISNVRQQTQDISGRTAALQVRLDRSSASKQR